LILQIRNLSKACRSSPQRLAQFKEGLQAANIAFETFGDPFDINPYAVAEKNACKRILNPLRDVPTRWNATYYMMERSLSVRKGLEEVTARNRDLRDLDLSDAEWALVKEAMEFLEPFALTTKHVEAFKYPTLSAVIPLFNKLMDDMEEWSNNTRHSEESRAGANAAFEKLNKYYSRTQGAHLVDTILDPRLKLEYFYDKGFADIDHTGVNLIETSIRPA
jgi:hypothetical protein